MSFKKRKSLSIPDLPLVFAGNFISNFKMSSFFSQDGLFDENVGPSLYAKSQGMPVKIWGFLGNGRVEYYVLPEDVDEKGKKKSTNMTGSEHR